MDATVKEGEYVMEITLANGCRLFVDREMLGNKRKVTSVSVGEKMGLREQILSKLRKYENERNSNFVDGSTKLGLQGSSLFYFFSMCTENERR